MPKQTAKGPQLTTSDRSSVMTVIGLLAGLIETDPNPAKRVAAKTALAANKAIIETHYPLETTPDPPSGD